ncbi:hypothetical protein IEO21_03147 [Rhodonia placenta]|uniref:F-box domain-containing protein n=1 Tax=Rhodonia placenta TaxID=104341 RepID=A0A8H7P653_9APHY|nr:hypothetical protein IEO21_03147 [Postia placenta]
MPTLPPELFDEAIDHLWDDPTTLRACSLTCRAFVPTARLHIFRTIRIQGAGHCDRFRALLATAPGIACCVRRLTICAAYKGVDAEGRALEDDAWVNTIAAVLPQLTRITTLGIARVRWNALLAETQCAFAELFRQVQTLFLFEVRFLASGDVLDFLSAFPVLTPLPLAIQHPGYMEARKEQERMQLSYLFLDPKSSPTLVTEWLLRHPSEQHLRSIQLCWREIDNMKGVGDLLHASGASLERLSIEFPAGVPEEAVLKNQISLVHNTGLRSVHFGGLKVAVARTFLSNHLFPWVTAMLSQIRSTHLQEIIFELELNTVRDLLSLDWARIDRDLSREEFKGLTVIFYVSCNDTIIGKAVKDVQKGISDCLPGFRERGTLCVSCI